MHVTNSHSPVTRPLGGASARPNIGHARFFSICTAIVVRGICIRLRHAFLHYAAPPCGEKSTKRDISALPPFRRRAMMAFTDYMHGPALNEKSLPRPPTNLRAAISPDGEPHRPSACPSAFGRPFIAGQGISFESRKLQRGPGVERGTFTSVKNAAGRNNA